MRTPLLTMLALLLAVPLTGQTATAFFTGEQTTGRSKQCYYSANGAAYTVTVGATQLCPRTVQVRTTASPQPYSPPAPSGRTTTAFFTGEQTTGTSKQCYYNALGSTYTRTVRSTQLCPRTVQVTP